MRVDLFDFELPDAQIATHPCEPRDQARMLHVDGGARADRIFSELPDLLQPGDVVVFNDSKVIPARLFGRRGDAVSGAKVELLLHKRVGDEWRAFARPAKRLKVGDAIIIADDFVAQVKDKLDGGEIVLSFNCQESALYASLEKYGHMPLPPYIKRADETDDQSDYQTVYAQHPGSVAAPTAGLHFTQSLLARLQDRGIHTEYVTLHVGAGTFQPVKVDDTAEHVMHHEWATIDEATAQRINAARAAGGRVIAIGTTALRILETVAADDGTLADFAGETDIFITPGYRFKVVDRLVTNFHLPRSTLFMLVSAFSGLEAMQAAYRHAIAQGYRFYSYGDACLLEKASS